MKIFAAGIASETNTFSPIPTSLEDFRIVRGEDVVRGGVSDPSLDLCALWGKQAQARGETFIFSLMAWADPAGVIVRSAYESLRDEILRDLRTATPVDVVLLNLHGAMMAEGYEDCEEDIVRRVRALVGPEVVIGVELDLHCHLSESKIAAADIVITYKEYPHLDIADRAEELFNLAIDSSLGKIRPTMALFDCRMVGLYPTTREPLRGFLEVMREAERREGVLSLSFAHGFQFADVPHVGAKVLAVVDNDQALARKVAREFGLQVYGLRRQIGCESFSLGLEEALSRALGSRRRPIVVADQSDNPGGGAPGDSTFAMRWLLDRHIHGVGIAMLYDPEIVEIAKKAGKGTTLALSLGGKLGPYSGDPVNVEATVISIRDNYAQAFPQRAGPPEVISSGDLVALRFDGIEIVVTNGRTQCFCPAVFSDLGIDPKVKRLLIVKSAQHFYAEFSPIAADVIYMSAPGAVRPDPRQTRYRLLRTERLYPWAEDPLGS